LSASKPTHDVRRQEEVRWEERGYASKIPWRNKSLRLSEGNQRLYFLKYLTPPEFFPIDVRLMTSLIG